MQKLLHPFLFLTHKKRYLAALALMAASIVALGAVPARTSAACTASPPYGSVNATITIPSTTTYRIWTRISTPDAANSLLGLEVDGNTCFMVGGKATGGWQWVDYQNGDSASKTELSLQEGSHRLRLLGLKAGVKVDRIIATSNLGCVPTNIDGSDCDNQDDTTAPTVTLTAPAAGATVTDKVTVSATASDNVAVNKVEFYLDNTLLASDTTSPYSFSLDTTLQANKSYLLRATATDAAGNVASSGNRSITIKNGDGTVPTTPTDLTATSPSADKVVLNWMASTDNVGVTGYVISRNGAPLTKVTGTSYTDTTVSARTTYTYSVAATDAANNTSASVSKSVTTPSPADTSAPTAPTAVTATAISRSQINITWKASADNIGVSSYDVYRQTGIAPAQKIATVNNTSLGDTTLQANTTYTYHVVARDAAGNSSPASPTASAKTQAEPAPTATKNSQLIGTVRNSKGQGIAYAKVSLLIDGKMQTFTANSKGFYDIYPIAGGKYTITYQATGYKTDSIYRNINPDARVNQNITLQKQ